MDGVNQVRLVLVDLVVCGQRPTISRGSPEISSEPWINLWSPSCCLFFMYISIGQNLGESELSGRIWTQLHSKLLIFYTPEPHLLLCPPPAIWFPHPQNTQPLWQNLTSVFLIVNSITCVNLVMFLYILKILNFWKVKYKLFYFLKSWIF